MPRGSPVAGSFRASTGLPKLIAARSGPLGAISRASGFIDPEVAQPHRKVNETNAAADFPIPGPPPCRGTALALYGAADDRTPDGRVPAAFARARPGGQPHLRNRREGEP